MLCQCPRALFPFQSSIMEEVLLTMFKKTVDFHVLSNLTSTTVVSTSFDLWISHDNVDTFALVINFLNENWVPCMLFRAI